MIDTSTEDLHLKEETSFKLGVIWPLVTDSRIKGRFRLKLPSLSHDESRGGKEREVREGSFGSNRVEKTVESFIP